MSREHRPALGILAGGGPLPGRVAAAAQATGRAVFIVGLEGFADPQVLAGFPHAAARVGAAGPVLALPPASGCRAPGLVRPGPRPSGRGLRPGAVPARLATPPRQGA